MGRAGMDRTGSDCKDNAYLRNVSISVDEEEI